MAKAPQAQTAQPSNVVPLAPIVSPRAGWPDANDVTDLLAIVEAQAGTVADQAALIDRYQGALAAAQAAPATSAIGTASGTPATTLTVTTVTGKILVGDTVTGTGIPAAPPATTVTWQQSGTLGGAGVYTLSQPTTASSNALTFSPGGAATTWPVPQDAVTLNTLTQLQTAMLRTQNALIQHYQDLLNTSQTPIS
jgi:hypothetical protein